MRQTVVLFFASLLLLSLGGCVSKTTRWPESQIAPSGEVSISKDQEAIEELRKNIPEQKRKENDLLKETLKMMGDGNEAPARVRDRFQKVVRDMQNNRRKQADKTRDAYNKKERKDREAFLKKLDYARDDFRRKKVDREKSREFYDEQDLKRKDFFAEQREKRQEFESENRQSQDDFRNMIREKQTEFDLEYRNYTKRYQEGQREAEAKRRAGGSPYNGTPGAAPTNYEPLQSGKPPGN